MSLDIQATYIQVDNKGTEQTHAVLVGVQFINTQCIQVKGKKAINTRKYWTPITFYLDSIIQKKEYL